MWSRYLLGGVSFPFISSAAAAAHIYLKHPIKYGAKCEILDAPNCNKKAYDYIVVGSGSGGSAVAGQLALLSNASVLLIEEGTDVSQSSFVNDASKCVEVLSDPDFKRAYRTTPQIGLNNRFQAQWKAIMTGGCASHNSMFWMLGSRKDFNERWNINGWKWIDLSPYWDKMNETDFDISTYSDDDGYKNVFLQAAKQCGYRYNDDYNDLNSVSELYGASCTQQNAKQMSPHFCRRQTSWTQYVEPVLCAKDNLDVMVNTKATKVLIDESTDKPIANGVRIKRKDDDEYIDISCNKEVILAAGTFDTVKLLMLSGVGDKEELEEEHGIRCISNAPAVGKNMEEHPCCLLVSPKLKGIKAESIAKQRTLFEGVLIVSDDGEYEHMMETVSNAQASFWSIGGFDDPQNVHILVFSQVEHYTSRGIVTIDKNNPEENKPVINPCYLSNEMDENKSVESFKRAKQLCYSAALMPLYDGDERDEFLPGYHIKSDEEILKWLKEEGLTATAHACGTCKMGEECTRDNLETVVVDNRLRVRGVDALRIADSSIMPSIVTGHTNAITILIGVKAADLILEDNGEAPCIKCGI